MQETHHRSRIEAALIAALFVGLGVGYSIYGSGDWAPELASRHGEGIDTMLAFLLVTTGAMFLVGHVVLGGLVWLGSRRQTVDRDHARPRPRIEAIASISLGLLMALAAEGGVVAIGLPVHSEYYGEIPEDALLIGVTGQQFAWNVHYPGRDGALGRTRPGLIDTQNPLGLDRSDPAAADDRVSINQITIPVNRPVRIRLRSRDVIHSFYLPHLRLKQDAVPGMTIDVWFVATREGRFEIPCTELCGLGHYRMQGFLNVLSEQEYEEWSRDQVAD